MPRLLQPTLLVFVLAGLTAMYAFRASIPIEATAESVRVFVASTGWWGPPVFVGLFLLRSMLLVPSVVLLTAGGICFGIAGGAVLGAAGLTSSALAKLVIAELAGRDKLLARIPERMRRRLAFVDGKAGPRTLALVTAYPVGPAEALHIAAILAGMQAIPFLTAIASGSFVRAASFSLFGDSLVAGEGLIYAVVLLSLLATLPPAILWLRRRAQRVKCETASLP